MPSRRRTTKNKARQLDVDYLLIRSLPSEILIRIFSYSICCCWGRRRSYDPLKPGVSPLTLAAVCTRWRRLVLGCRALWTHIDVIFDVLDKGGRYHDPNIWIERSEGAPANLHIFQFRVNIESFQRDERDEADALLYGRKRTPAPMVQRLFRFLSPLMPQIRCAAMFIRWPYEAALNRFLDLWTGTSQRTKSLQVQSDSSGINLTIHGSAQNTMRFKSLEALRLHNTNLSWNEFDFKNLIELDIQTTSDNGWRMTQSELAAALASCPRLQRLIIDQLDVKPAPAQKPDPAVLAHLRILRLGAHDHVVGCKEPLMVEAILGIIDSRQSDLSMDISLSYIESPQQALDSLISFIHRSNVTTLRVHGCDRPGRNERPCFASQIGPLPNVQTLILEHCYFRDVLRLVEGIFIGNEPRVFHNPRPINPEIVIWPSLKNLRLERCSLEKEHMRQLLSHHTIQTLHMRNCFDDRQTRDFKNRFDVGSTTSKDYVRLLSQIIPTVVHFSTGWYHWESIFD
ncbi:hypothetical protein FRC12_007175 [Ceratobasidium sp. 428]|nr:hypothetical protein FRC12_007175 [Ceratobasidium sp. 428]